MPDLLTSWPLDDQRFGLVAVFSGASSYERAHRHRRRLEQEGVPQKLCRERDGTWTLRFGPLALPDVSTALGAFQPAGSVAAAAA